jgi:rhodanese-related sulfurtransferase
MRKETALLLLISFVATALVWGLNPNRLPLIADSASYEMEINFELVDAKNAVQLFNNNLVILVDVQSNSKLIIPGAFHIRQDSFDDDFRDLFDFVLPEDKLLLIGNGDLMIASAIAEKLSERGYKNLVLLQGDISSWQAAGGEVK